MKTVRLCLLTMLLAGISAPVHAAERVALLSGPAPELEFNEGEVDTLVPGAQLFLDGRYTVLEVPGALGGKKFIRFNSVLGRAICREPGVVYVLAPVASSMGDRLLKQGFTQADIPSFKLFEANDRLRRGLHAWQGRLRALDHTAVRARGAVVSSCRRDEHSRP